MREQENRNEHDLTRMIKIDGSKGNGIKYESVDEFYSSFFRDNYYDAFLMTAEVIRHNEEIIKSYHPLNQDRIYNMITFTGDRGTGKTSVMYSFLEALGGSDREGIYEFLRKYEEQQNRKNDIGSKLRDTGFVCLEEIDASLLETNEDILEVILAKMFQKFEDSSRPLDSRYTWYAEEQNRSAAFGREDIIRMFEKLFKSNRYIMEKREYKTGESTSEILGNLSQSLTLRDTFKRFVPMYLRSILGSDRRQNYLVISIDDLDMGDNGYEKLEKLHRYLMVPGVIIYLAASGNELASICRNHFERVYMDHEHLSMAYLEKVLPFSQRIYMPSLLNNGFNVVIEPDNLPVKETILRKIIHRTRVAYDGCSLKTHFYEVGNLRTLVNLYIFLEHMEKLEPYFPEIRDDMNDEQKKAARAGQLRSMATFDANTEKLRNDVINRHAANKLMVKEEKDCFQKFCEEDATRRENSFVTWVVEQISPFERGSYFRKEYERAGYNYGEFFSAIYLLEHERNKYKSLRHCILAIETIMLTRTYIHAYMDPKEDVRAKHKERWEEIISDSIFGMCANSMLPKYGETEGKSSAATQLFEVGYMPKQEIEYAFRLLEGEKTISQDSPVENCRLLIEKAKLVERLELLFMFLGPIRKKDINDIGRIRIEKATDQEDKEEKKKKYQMSQQGRKDGILDTDPSEDSFETKDVKAMKITITKHSYTFDAFGFAVNCMDRAMFFDRLEQWILDAIRIYIGGQWNECVKSEFMDKIARHSLRKEHEEWFDRYDGMAMPAYSAEIMYKLFKRVLKESRKKYPRVLSEGVPVQIFRMYGLMAEQLGKEDDFYRDIEGKSCGVDYKKAFLECPFIKLYYSLWKDDSDDAGNSKAGVAEKNTVDSSNTGNDVGGSEEAAAGEIAEDSSSTGNSARDSEEGVARENAADNSATGNGAEGSGEESVGENARNSSDAENEAGDRAEDATGEDAEDDGAEENDIGEPIEDAAGDDFEDDSNAENGVAEAKDGETGNHMNEPGEKSEEHETKESGVLEGIDEQIWNLMKLFLQKEIIDDELMENEF